MSAEAPVRLARMRAAAPESVAEIAFAVVLAASAAMLVGPRPLLVGLVWLAWVTPRLIAVDIAEHRLPDAIVLPGYPVAMISVLADALIRHATVDVAIAAALGYGVVLLVLHVAGGMGFGDVKLAPVLGMLAGSAGLAPAVLSPVLAMFAGGIMAVAVLIRRGLHSSMPFGPAMLIGVWAAIALAR